MLLPRTARTFAVLLMLTLAGCASDPESGGADPRPPSPGAPDATSPGGEGLVAATFPGALAQELTIWANGTFRVDQANGAPGLRLPDGPADSLVQIDVTSIVPKDVPVILVADLVVQMSQGEVLLGFSVPDAQGRNGAGNFVRGGPKHFERGLVRTTDSPILVNVFYAEAEAAAEVPYTLSVRAVFDPTVVRAAFPIGFTPPSGASSVTIEVVGEERAWADEPDELDLMLWAPDDTFLGHFTVAGGPNAIPLPANAGEGEYVAILQQGGRSMRVLADGPMELRALPQEFVVSEPATDATQTRAAWATDHARVPILAGIFFSGSSAATGVRASLAGPSGTLFDVEIPSGPDAVFLNVDAPGGAGFVSSFGWDSSYAVPGLAAGRYEAVVEFEQGAGAQDVDARDFGAFWVR